MLKSVIIRQENPADYPIVFDLIKESFKNEEHTDHREHFLVERLRTSDGFVPELSLVAAIDGEVVGYILLTKVKIIGKEVVESLAMAPVAVLPEYQNQGIGGKLIVAAHNKAKELGFESVIVLGHEGYYPKFGFKLAESFGIKPPFDVPSENFMAMELVDGALEGVEGVVKYAEEFG
jgi:predicted N-acetyltransferase YhbS